MEEQLFTPHEQRAMQLIANSPLTASRLRAMMDTEEAGESVEALVSKGWVKKVGELELLVPELRDHAELRAAVDAAEERNKHSRYSSDGAPKQFPRVWCQARPSTCATA